MRAAYAGLLLLVVGCGPRDLTTAEKDGITKRLTDEGFTVYELKQTSTNNGFLSAKLKGRECWYWVDARYWAENDTNYKTGSVTVSCTEDEPLGYPSKALRVVRKADSPSPQIEQSESAAKPTVILTDGIRRDVDRIRLAIFPPTP